MNPRRKLFIAVGGTILIVLVVFILSMASNPYNPKADREPEKGGGPSLVISNTEDLGDSLLPAQFDATKSALTTFITGNIKPDAQNAQISETKVDGGIVTFTVKVDNSQTFTARVDKWSYYDKLVFSVPEKSYSTTLLIYNN